MSVFISFPQPCKNSGTKECAYIRAVVGCFQRECGLGRSLYSKGIGGRLTEDQARKQRFLQGCNGNVDSSVTIAEFLMIDLPGQQSKIEAM
jgi:hypothetical protein